MNSEASRRIDKLLDEALDLPPEQRAGFLAQACGNNPELLAHLQGVLQAHERSGGILNEPELNVLAKKIAAAAPTLTGRYHTESLAGTTLSHYRVVERIGSGGMGEVYLAEDTKLGRKVAIKFLPPDSTSDERARHRLIREAKAAAKLDHPNICSIYEIIEQGERCCIVMQYVEGETLAAFISRGLVPSDRTIEIASQVAEGLAEAHSRGIIHRDIKPQNIMVTPRGQVKILDFGLAKFIPADVAADELETLGSVTEEGIAGTIPYMSPEQVRGETLDGRTDVFSLGVVIYEMLAGRSPFAAKTKAETIAAILTQDPLALPASLLDSVVDRALRKDREARYRTAGELLEDLKSIGPPAKNRTPFHRFRLLPALAFAAAMVLAVALIAYFFLGKSAPSIDSLAILPFANMGGDSNMEYLSDGISDGIISSLSQISSLRVISLSSVLRYKGQQVDPQAVGRDLNVRAVVMGRVAEIGDSLSISAELIDMRDNRRLWGQQYNRKFSDILQLQLEISREISEKLRVKLTGDDQRQLAKGPTTDIEAYRLFLQGRFYWNKYTEADFKKSIDYYTRAVERDPNYAVAYAGLADTFVQLAMEFLVPDAVPKAKEYASRALALDDTLAEAHMSLGEVKLFFDWDWPSAEKEFKRAIELNPNYPDTYHFYGHYLETVGKYDDAIRTTKRGLELDPNSAIINSELAWAYIFASQHDLAITQIMKTLELDPRFGIARQYLGKAYTQLGRFEEGIAELNKARDLNEFPEIVMDLASAYALSGKRAEAEKIARELEEKISKEGLDPYLLAPVYASLGEIDKAFAYLYKAFDKHSFWLAFVQAEPLLQPLRADRRFTDLVRRIGIPGAG